MFECTSVTQWIASQDLGKMIWDCFPGEEVMNLLLNFIEVSNEEIIGAQQKEEVLW